MIFKICVLVAILMAGAQATGVRPGVTFSYVVDVTGSMGTEIRLVRDAINNSTAHLAGFRRMGIDHFVLVTFSDPAYKVYHYEFRNLSSLHYRVSRLSATGGGDCPEYGLTGLMKAINLSRPNSYIFYFSDASVKDSYLQTSVITAARAKNVRIWIMATSCCTGSCGTYSVYKAVANETNGVYYPITSMHSEMSLILNFVTESVKCHKFENLNNPPKNLYTMGYMLSRMRILSSCLPIPTTARPPVTPPVIVGGAAGLTGGVMSVLMVAISTLLIET